MAEQRLHEKQFDLLYDELRRIVRSRPDIIVVGWSNDDAPAVEEQFRAAGAIACAQKGDYDALRVLLSEALPA